MKGQGNWAKGNTSRKKHLVDKEQVEELKKDPEVLKIINNVKYI